MSQPLQSKFLLVEEALEPPSSFCFRIGNGWDYTAEQFSEMGEADEGSPDGLKLYTLAYCVLPRDAIPRYLDERAVRVAEYFADKQNQICVKPILSISHKSLCCESWENVRALCERFRLLPPGYHFPLPELDEDGEEIPLPLDVWERAMNYVGAGLTGLANVDANMQSLCWLNAGLLKPRDWFKVLKVVKFQGPISLDNATATGIKFFQEVFERPYLLSQRRLNEPDIEHLLYGIAELLFDSVGTFRNVKECKKFIAEAAMENFEMVASDVKKLSFVFQKDVYATCGALASGFWGTSWPASSALCLKRIWSMLFWVRGDRSVELIDCISGGEYSKIKGSDAESLVCWFLLKDPRVGVLSGETPEVVFDGFVITPRGEDEPPANIGAYLGIKRKRSAPLRVETSSESVGPTVSQLFPVTPVASASTGLSVFRSATNSASFSFSRDLVDLVDDDNLSFVDEIPTQVLPATTGSSSVQLSR